MKHKVTAVGETLWDLYSDKKRLGGAPFNFIYHVWKIAGNANFISNVGNDENGKELLSFFQSVGFNTTAIKIDNEHKTGAVKVELDENKIPQFTMPPESSFDYLRLDSISRNIFENETDLLYFGTFTVRSEVSRSTLLSMLNRKDKKYFCDLNFRHDFFTKELLEEILPTCDVIKLNQEELDKLKTFFSFDYSNEKAIEQFINLFDIELIGLTLGEHGAELYTKNEMNKYIMDKRNVVDTLGAGDAFAAILSLGYLKGMHLEGLNKLANEFAYEICMIDGAIPQNDNVYLKYQNVFST